MTAEHGSIEVLPHRIPIVIPYTSTWILPDLFQLWVVFVADLTPHLTGMYLEVHG